MASGKGKSTQRGKRPPQNFFDKSVVTVVSQVMETRHHAEKRETILNKSSWNENENKKEKNPNKQHKYQGQHELQTMSANGREYSATCTSPVRRRTTSREKVGER